MRGTFNPKELIEAFKTITDDKGLEVVRHEVTETMKCLEEDKDMLDFIAEKEIHADIFTDYAIISSPEFDEDTVEMVRFICELAE